MKFGKSSEYDLEVVEAGMPDDQVMIKHNDSETSFTNVPLDEPKTIKESPSQNVLELKERQQWDKPIEFLLSCIAMSVGLGNIWRFPYVAFNNGGGAFLIPYLIVLLFISKPVYFLELCMGQFCSKGSCKVWQMVPFFKGVGYSATFGTACLLSFYCALMANTIFYLYNSFSSELPWSKCNPDWNYTCINNTAYDSNGSVIPNPALYFTLEVYKEKSQIDDGIGYPDWRLSLCLLTAWILVFITLIKGIESAGKAAYFTAIYPYSILLIFLIRGVTLPGAWTGISYFLTPNFGKLLEGKVWIEAVTQCFFSMSIAFGPVISFASFNNFSHNIYRDAMIVSLMDTFTSLLAGITVFSVLGNLAEISGNEIQDVVKSGPGLAFVSFSDAISKFPFLPQLFSVLFFSMMLILGVGSATSLAGGIITVIHDKFTNWRKEIITIVVCVAGFLIGLVYVTPGGLWILGLVDKFGAGSIIYMIAILELVGMIYVYGLSSIVRDIEFMINRKIGIYWQLCWVLSPVILTIVFIYSIFTAEPFTNGGHMYPTIAIVCGWLLVGIALVILPLFALHGVYQQTSEDGFLSKLKQSFKPLVNEWGPADPKTRAKWENLPAEKGSVFRRLYRRLQDSNFY